MPDMDELGNHTSPKAHIAFERYARLIYGKHERCEECSK